MIELAIDIETYSATDLKKSGVYKYVEDPEFEILLFGYSIDGGPVTVIDLTDLDDVPEEIMAAMTDPAVLKTAFNANFERTCIAKYFNIECDPAQWECTMVKCAYIGLPMSLDQASKVLKLEEGKDSKGKALIRYFAVPRKPTKTNGGRTRNLPHHAPEKWTQFVEYCGKDVVAEVGIRKKLAFYVISDFEKRLWVLDQQINDRGILIDRVFVRNAIAFDQEYKARITEEIKILTGLDNPNSPAQLKTWLSEESGEEVTSLTKDYVKEMLDDSNFDAVSKVLELRQEMAKTSVAKYVALEELVCADGRIRGIIQFGGACRTMRWAGRRFQPQNLPRNYLHDLDLARKLVACGDLDLLELLFGNVPDTLSQLIRTSLISEKGVFTVSDFSAIEARVIAWIAREKWRMDVFKTHGKIYEASAAQMFKVPIESITKDNPLRQKGKISELACGFGGGPNALIQMGALDGGLTEEELPAIIKAWRAASPKIVEFWYALQRAAISAIEGEPRTTHGITYSMSRGVLWAKLPSGRSLSYFKPGLEEGKYGPQITYWGMNQTTRQWEKQRTYSGKLAENVVQAIARDCLAEAMLKADAAGYNIVMHVHDEIVADGGGGLDKLNAILAEPIPWAKGLPLGAAGFENYYYKKD